MRGKLIPVKAKKRIEGVFEIGDELFIQAILHSKPKLLHRAIGCAFLGDGTPIGFHSYPDVMDKEVGEKVFKDDIHKNGQYLAKVFEESYAPVGSLNYFVIITADGREHNDKILSPRRFDYVFDKILN